MAELKLVDADYLGHPRYQVLVDGEVIGAVFGHNPTFERSPRGSRIVSKRWRSKKRYWIAEPIKHHWNIYRLPYETRERAVEAVVAHWERLTTPESPSHAV